MGLGTGLAQVHVLLAVATAVVAGLLVVLGLLDATGMLTGARSKRWVDRAILALLALAAATAILGPLIVILVGPPRDWLHLLYAAVAIGAAPVARLEAARRNSTRAGAWVALGGLVTLGALLRLWGTGG
ncbi:MAG TPA: hypothetical protein VFY23_02800 [Candidatus Limnocylindrales bacterium]|nr:hypothetical protein [Candidatus Limnocylindrales bacterium]